MRDYISQEVQGTLKLVDDLVHQRGVVSRASSQERDAAEKKLENIRQQLLSQVPTAAQYELLVGIRETKSLAIGLRTKWQTKILQEKNQSIDCLQLLIKNWKEGRNYYQIFATPTIDLSLLPVYSFVIQITFKLAQPYISRDEQNFYIIDNPVRKDKVFGLPYVASTSWKGSLRSTLWHLGHKEKSNVIRRLFGNEKGTDDPEHFRSGRLHFFPTFFTMKSLEIINPQDRELRAGTDPIPFESVPEGSEGTFTLLYIPFDLIGEDGKKSRDQVTQDLKLVAQGIQAMFRIYGFGAKTSSGFGLARESIQKALLEIGAPSPSIQKVSEGFISFESLSKVAENLSQELKGELQHD